jgi:hypothetical protein
MKVKVPRNTLIRDWLAIDYAILGKSVTTKHFNEEFVHEWNVYKHDLLKRHYALHEDAIPQHVIDPVQEAFLLAQDLRGLLIARIEKARLAEATNILAKKVFSAKEPREARSLAQRLYLAKEALCNFVGEENSHIYKMVRLLARSSK